MCSGIYSGVLLLTLAIQPTYRFHFYVSIRCYFLFSFSLTLFFSCFFYGVGIRRPHSKDSNREYRNRQCENSIVARCSVHTVTFWLKKKLDKWRGLPIQNEWFNKTEQKRITTQQPRKMMIPKLICDGCWSDGFEILEFHTFILSMPQAIVKEQIY